MHIEKRALGRILSSLLAMQLVRHFEICNRHIAIFYIGILGSVKRLLAWLCAKDALSSTQSTHTRITSWFVLLFG